MKSRTGAARVTSSGSPTPTPYVSETQLVIINLMKRWGKLTQGLAFIMIRAGEEERENRFRTDAVRSVGRDADWRVIALKEEQLFSPGDELTCKWKEKRHSCRFLILHTVPQRPEKMEDPHRHAGGVGDGDDDSRGGRVKHSSVV